MLHFEGVKNLGPLWFIRSLSIPRAPMFFSLAEFFVVPIPSLCLHSHGEKQRSKDRRWLLIAERRGTGLSLECLLPCQVFHVRSSFKKYVWHMSCAPLCHSVHQLPFVTHPFPVLFAGVAPGLSCLEHHFILFITPTSFFLKFLMVSKHLQQEILKFTSFWLCLKFKERPAPPPNLVSPCSVQFAWVSSCLSLTFSVFIWSWSQSVILPVPYLEKALQYSTYACVSD